MSDLISRSAVLELIRNLRHGKKLRRSKQSVADRIEREVQNINGDGVYVLPRGTAFYWPGDPVFTRDQLDAIRATDRETITKQIHAYMTERYGPAAAAHLSGFLRGGA